MAGNYPWGVTDNDPYFDQPNKYDGDPKPQKCYACKGTGVCQDCDPDKPDGAEFTTEECPSCRWTGECEVCEGNGVLE